MTKPVKILAIMPGGMQGIEETGCIGEVVQRRGAVLQWAYRLRQDRLPNSSSEFDGLIVFGGEIGAHDPQYSEYFNQLYPLIRSFHAAGKPVLGSCLGAQSIACALGGRAMPQGFFEFGFAVLRATDEARFDPLLSGMPESLPLFEMHFDTFVLPENAVLLLQGDRVRNQVFRIGAKTYGFQPHFEASLDVAHLWKTRELVTEPNFSEAQTAETFARLELEFEKFSPAQRSFGMTVVNRWMDLFEGEKLHPVNAVHEHP